MREHSGAEGKNNNRDPNMKEAERRTGKSGQAIQAEKKIKAEPSRQSTAKSS